MQSIDFTDLKNFKRILKKVLTLLLNGCIIKTSLEDSHFFSDGFLERQEMIMKTTLVKAMLILNYVMSHTTDIEKVGIRADVNGVTFTEYTYTMMFFSDEASDIFKRDVIQQLNAIGKDSNIFVHIATLSDGKRWMTFRQCY